MLKNTKQRRAIKRTEAEARQQAYDKLSLEDKLSRAKKGGRQFNRLISQAAKKVE